MTAPHLMTDRLQMVSPAPRHREDFVAFYASQRAAARGWLRDTPDALKFWTFLTDHWDRRGFGWFVIEETASKTPIGMCGPWESEQMPEGELAWSLWHDHVEGKGYAYEAALAARTYAYHDLGWTTAVSYISYDNPRSIALARRLGAAQDGEWTTPSGNRVAVYRHPSPEALQ
jgi:RimJ/RimL family protein N-acetyltransferase